MVALPHVRDELHFSVTALSWVQNAYTLVFGGMLLLGARVGDLLGRRRTFVLGIGIFTVASLVVGLAQSPAMLIAARAAQGIGAATLAPATLALLSTTFPQGAERHRAMAAYGALAGIGVTIGLLLGGAFTDLLSWRVGFFINVPFGVAAMLAAPRFLPETARHQGQVELAAALSSTLGVAALVFGIVHSADAGWTDPSTVGALAAGLALVVFFVTDQARSVQPILPLRLFADRQRSGAYAARFLFNGALLSSFYFLTLYLRDVSGYTPLQAGVAFLPQTLTGFAVASTVPAVTRRFGTPAVGVMGAAAMVIATVWLSRLTAHTDYLSGVALPMLFYGAAQGLALSSLTTAGMAGVTTEDAGVAGGLVNVAHHLGGALGLGILTTVFASANTHSASARELLAHRVDAAFTGGSVLVVVALAVTVLVARASRAGFKPPNASIGTGLDPEPVGETAPVLDQPSARYPLRRRTFHANHPQQHRHRRRGDQSLLLQDRVWSSRSSASSVASASGENRRAASSAMAQRLWLTTSTLCPSGSRTKAP
jgi:EmrB/QacA subfamily drug resistance transporter